LRRERFDCSDIIAHHRAIAAAIQNAIRYWFCGFLRVCSARVRRWQPPPPPKISVRLGRSMPAQILWERFEPYPSQPPTLVWRLLDC
jgi:hypothetical protein